MPKREMLINYVPGEECRIAIVEDGRLEELYQERASSESHVGNIYKGRVTNVEPSIQAAFVDFGLERNGFLHISDLHPMYFPGDQKEETEAVGDKIPRRDRPPIQRCLRRGQNILVQVLKEGIGTKGPTLTSYLSIPGRYLVMMPSMEGRGVSRKVEDDDVRRAMRGVLEKLSVPKGFGFIMRTEAEGRPETEIKRDLAYLKRVWKNIDKRMKEVRVGELFAEADLVIRTIRDVYSSDIERIIVDDPTAARRAQDFLSISNPRSGANVLVYRDPVPVFHRFEIEHQIETINSRTVPLPSGGSLVIDSTEALVAIDVNSGKYRDHRDAETTAYKTNLEAVDEICRQLRLRDLGGVIVNDLIDMRNPKFRREVEHRFRENLKRDRARTRIAAISPFGILEMTRQRMRPSLRKSLYVDCAACQGAGSTKSPESVVLEVMRRLALVMHRQAVARLELTVSPDVAFLLLNRKRGQLVGIEEAYGKPVLVRVNAAGPVDYLALAAFDARGGVVDIDAAERFTEPTLERVETIVDETLDEADEAEEETSDEAAAQTAAEARADNGRADEQEEEAPTTGTRAEAGDAEAADGERRRRRRRRCGRRRRRGGAGEEAPAATGAAGGVDMDADAQQGDGPPTPALESAETVIAAEEREPLGESAADADAETAVGPDADEPDDEVAVAPLTAEGAVTIADGETAAADTPAKEAAEAEKRRRRRRGGRGRRKKNGNGDQAASDAQAEAPPAEAPTAPPSETPKEKPGRSRGSRGRGSKSATPAPVKGNAMGPARMSEPAAPARPAPRPAPDRAPAAPREPAVAAAPREPAVAVEPAPAAAAAASVSPSRGYRGFRKLRSDSGGSAGETSATTGSSAAATAASGTPSTSGTSGGVGGSGRSVSE